MRKDAKPFFRNAVILTIATVLIGVLMNDWGAAQILIIILLAILSAAQWLLYAYMRKR